MPTPIYEPAFMATAVGMVRAGLGATLLPSSALEIATASDVVVHTLDNPELTRQVGVLKKRDRAHSPAALALVEMLSLHATRWFARRSPGSPHQRANPTIGETPSEHPSNRGSRLPRRR